jgi:hypothetical protein
MIGVFIAVDIMAATICREHKPAGAREYWSWREIGLRQEKIDARRGNSVAPRGFMQLPTRV